MPPSELQIIGSASPSGRLPIDIEQRANSASAFTRLAILLPALLLVLVPAASLALGSSPALAHASAHPGEALLAAGGLMTFLILFGFPFGRALGSLAARRRLSIHAGIVSVEDQSLWRTVRWNRPLETYSGIAHLVRTSLSGTRHEIVLVHPVRACCVLLRSAERLPETEVSDIARLLRLPVIPARDLLPWPMRMESLPPAAEAPPEVAQAA